MTYKPLTDDLGEELLMSYRAGFHAKIFQSQEREMGLKEKDPECGEKWRGSFTKYDPDLSLWRTHQCSLLGDLEAFSETWPQWGLMRNGECWEQTTLERTIKGTGFGLEENKWATPTTMDKLPPKSAQALHKEATQARPNRSKPANLRDQVSNMQNWPTPNAWDGRRGPMSKELMETGKHQISLVTAVKHNPTRWGTPKAQDSRHALRDRNKGNLGEQVSGLHNGGKLNPLWTEWLMGWWIGWTDLKPLEMDKSPSALPLHGES
jgi:DNA (cytosine-5)-methyltransferase 1